MFDYTILGAGAVGCVYGARLCNAGHKTQLITRSTDLGRAIAQNGLQIDCDGDIDTSHPETALPSTTQPSRIVIVLTKTFQATDAVLAIRDHMPPETVWVTLQNGLGNAERLAKLVEGPVLLGPATFPAGKKEMSRIWTSNPYPSTLGPLDIKDKGVNAQIAQDLTNAGIHHDPTDNPAPRIWQKACFNAAMNATAALTLGGPGLAAATPGMMQEIHAIAAEARAVATAKGIQIDAERLRNALDNAAADHTYHKPSMHQDIAAGRKTEIDALNGYIVQCAEELGIPAPRNALLTAMIHARENSEGFWANQTNTLD